MAAIIVSTIDSLAVRVLRDGARFQTNRASHWRIVRMNQSELVADGLAGSDVTIQPLTVVDMERKVLVLSQLLTILKRLQARAADG
jgi:hypothetical protein